MTIEQPEFFTALPDEGEQIEAQKDAFFENVLQHLGYTSPELRRGICEIRSRPILRSEDKQPTDDRITELIVRSQIVAAVLEIRTEFNNVAVLPAVFLSPEREEQIRAPQGVISVPSNLL